MKKNLLYLFALICSVTLFTACSDDDDPVGLSTATMAGTYQGSIDVYLGSATGSPIVDGMEVPVTVTRQDDANVTVALSNFTIPNFLDDPVTISVPCSVEIVDGDAIMEGTSTVTIEGIGADMPVSVTGASDGSNMGLDIEVAATVLDMPMTVYVEFVGSK